jgi:hypothetical protein
MNQIMLGVTALAILVLTARAYLVTRDALHPLIYLGPMLLYHPSSTLGKAAYPSYR